MTDVPKLPGRLAAGCWLARMLAVIRQQPLALLEDRQANRRVLDLAGWQQAVGVDGGCKLRGLVNEDSLATSSTVDALERSADFTYHVLRIATCSRIDMGTYFYVSRTYVLRIATYLRISYRIRHMKGIV